MNKLPPAPRLVIEGDVAAAAPYVGLAKKLARTAYQGGVRAKSYLVAARTTIRVENYPESYLSKVFIHAKSKDVYAVYEFAATNMATLYNIHRWFVIYVKKDGSWFCRSYPDHNKFSIIPLLKKYESLDCIPVGDLVVCAPNKINSMVSFFSKNEFSYFSIGAGNLHNPTSAVALYGNYQWESYIPETYWYGLVGRDTPFGINEAIAQSRYRSEAGFIYEISITAPGVVKIVRSFDGYTVSKELELPDWVKSNELGLGYAWGVWKFDSSGLKAISVLHGNPYCFGAYNSFFDETRIVSELETDAAIYGAFLSAIYTITISITSENDQSFDFQLNLSLLEGTEQQGVSTYGLGFGAPERNTNGIYYFAADFIDGDIPVYCYIELQMRQIISWEFSESVCTGGNPDCNIEYIPSNYGNFSILASGVNYNCPPCNLSKYMFSAKNVLWLSKSVTASGVYSRSNYIHSELKFSESLGISPIVVRHKNHIRTIDYYEGKTGVTGVNYYGSRCWSVGNDGVIIQEKVLFDEVIPFVMGWVTGVNDFWENTSVPACLSRPGEAVRKPFSKGYTGNSKSWEELNIYEDEIKVTLNQIDLRGKIVSYKELKTVKGDELGMWLETQAYGDSGVFYPTNETVIETAYFVSLDENTSHVLSTEETTEDPPITERWDLPLAPAGYEDSSDVDDYPLQTRLWHHMVLGTMNPKTPDGLGGFVWWDYDLQNYYPRQTFRNADTIASHPNGSLAARYASAGIDFIKIVHNKYTLEISHEQAIQNAMDKAEIMIENYLTANPTKTRDEAIEATGAVTEEIFNLLNSYVQRGEWVF